MAELFQLELVKLLVRVAWADHRVVRTEVDIIRDVARKLGIVGDELAQVEIWMHEEQGVPAPNLSVLKPHRQAVLAAVRTLVLADNRIAPEEAALVREIEAALS